MAVICKQCARGKEISLPPVRTRMAPCQFCGSTSEDPKGRNYDYPDKLMPGNPSEPNAVADREDAGVS